MYFFIILETKLKNNEKINVETRKKLFGFIMYLKITDVTVWSLWLKQVETGITRRIKTATIADVIEENWILFKLPNVSM